MLIQVRRNKKKSLVVCRETVDNDNRDDEEIKFNYFLYIYIYILLLISYFFFFYYLLSLVLLFTLVSIKKIMHLRCHNIYIYIYMCAEVYFVYAVFL